MKELYLHEAWDVLDAMKRLVDEDRARARTLLETYPQVVEALVQIQRRLGMLPTVSGLPSGTGGERNNVEQSSSAALSSSAMTSGSSQGSGGISGNDPIQQAIQMARAQVTDFFPKTIVSRSLVSLFSHILFSQTDDSGRGEARGYHGQTSSDPTSNTITVTIIAVTVTTRDGGGTAAATT